MVMHMLGNAPPNSEEATDADTDAGPKMDDAATAPKLPIIPNDANADEYLRTDTDELMDEWMRRQELACTIPDLPDPRCVEADEWLRKVLADKLADTESFAKEWLWQLQRRVEESGEV